MKLLNWLLGTKIPQATPPNSTAQESEIASKGVGISKTALAIKKAMYQLDTVARSYLTTICNASNADLARDLETMLAANDLKTLRFELLDHDGLVVFEFKLNFVGIERSVQGLPDSGAGIELPILKPGLVAGRRLVVERNGRDAQYSGQLRLNWGDVKIVARSSESTFASEHAAKITGGRQSGTFHVTDIVRHQFVINELGSPKHAFARDLDNQTDRVFVLAKLLPTGCTLKLGTKFTGILVQTRRGLQVRSLRRD